MTKQSVPHSEPCSKQGLWSQIVALVLSTPGDAVGSSALEISQIQVEEVMYGIFSIGDNPFSSRRPGEVIF